MPKYAGNWLECHNQHCGFPIRVPVVHLEGKSGRRNGNRGEFLFACPVCLEVNSYRGKDLHRVQFRTPDPYHQGKLVLYSTTFSCAHPRCSVELAIYATAAADVSVATLVEFWKRWKVNLRCAAGHVFRMPKPAAWWIQEEKALRLVRPPSLPLSKK